MNNTQLYVAISIPSILVILAWITSLMQNNRLDTKIETLGTNLRTEIRADRKELTDKMDKLGESIHADLKEFFKTIHQHDIRITRVEDYLEPLKSKERN